MCERCGPRRGPIRKQDPTGTEDHMVHGGGTSKETGRDHLKGRRDSYKG